MTYEEFEWHILRMVYEEGVERMKPASLAYALGLPLETVKEYLECATQSGLVEMDITEDGHLEYFVPGFDRSIALPTPIWKEGASESGRTSPSKGRESTSADFAELQDMLDGADAELISVDDACTPDDYGPTKNRQGFWSESTDGSLADGSVGENTSGMRPRRDQAPAGALVPYRGAASSVDTAASPFQHYVQKRVADTDGSVNRGGHWVLGEAKADSPRVVQRDVRIDSDFSPVGALVPARAQVRGDLLRVESSDDAFCDPSQTILMRQIRVYGVQSEEVLREHIQRLFESFGYRMIRRAYDPEQTDRLRFERGSVTFILALVPLFVLVLPLFVYLFLYCMGRSTIHQEPLELDVQIRKASKGDAYEIDLTFIGLHGIVLGAADQRVLNQEIDTLRDELRWSLAAGSTH